MARKILWASVQASAIPRVRFFANGSGSGKDALIDVTLRVAKVEIEDLQDESGSCNLLRLDSAGNLIWKTRHPSKQETLWHAEFEYGLPEDRWNAYNGA